MNATFITLNYATDLVSMRYALYIKILHAVNQCMVVEAGSFYICAKQPSSRLSRWSPDLS